MNWQVRRNATQRNARKNQKSFLQSIKIQLNKPQVSQSFWISFNLGYYVFSFLYIYQIIIIVCFPFIRILVYSYIFVWYVCWCAMRIWQIMWSAIFEVFALLYHTLLLVSNDFVSKYMLLIKIDRYVNKVWINRVWARFQFIYLVIVGVMKLVTEFRILLKPKWRYFQQKFFIILTLCSITQHNIA